MLDASAVMARQTLLRAEQALLANIPGCKSFDVSLIGAGTLDAADSAPVMHTIELDLRPGSKEPALVFIHGYGLGAGTAAMLLSSFAEKAKVDSSAVPYAKIYVLDWPGCGLSSCFDKESLVTVSSETTESMDEDSTRDAAFAAIVRGSCLQGGLHSKPPPSTDLEKFLLFFSRSLEQWRLAMGIKHMTLMGHSIGGYLSFSYCEWLRESSRLRHAAQQSRNPKDQAATLPVSHLILASPCGLPTRPDFRTPPFSHDTYVDGRAEDLAAGRRPLSEFDAGSRKRTRVDKLRRNTRIGVCCCCPCLSVFCWPCAAVFCSLRRCTMREKTSDVNACSDQLSSPVIQVMRRARWSWLLGRVLRLGLFLRMENNGQWKSGVRARLTTYLRELIKWNTAHGTGSRSPAFSEHLFDCLVFNSAKTGVPTYNSFGWTRAPLAGNAREVPFGLIQFAPATTAATPSEQAEGHNYSDGRMQRFLKTMYGKAAGDFRLSFLYGDEDWMDVRSAAGMREEALSVGGQVDIALVQSCGHQIPLDNPDGLAEAVLRLSQSASPPV